MRYLLFYAVDAFAWCAALIPGLLLAQLLSGHRLSWKRRLGMLVLAVYLAMVYNLAGGPEITRLYPIFNINFMPFVDIFQDCFAYLLLSALNIALFVPLGIFLPMLWKAFRSGRIMAFTGLFVSLGIELLQLLNYRISDVDDLIMNTLGAVIGYQLLMFVNRRSPVSLLMQDDSRGRRQFLVILCVVIAVMFALRPYITRFVSGIIL